MKNILIVLFVILSFTNSFSLGWSNIPNTKIRTYCPETNYGGSNYDFNYYCNGVVNNWNSAIYNDSMKSMIIWGGGHNDYLGNELYKLDLNSNKMERLTNPDFPVPAGECPENIGNNPNSRHTYDGISYMKNTDKMFVFGGSLSTCGYMSQSTWEFDFKTVTWKLLHPTGKLPKPVPGIVSVYDPNSNLVFVHDDWNLYSYNHTKNEYTTLLTNTSALDYHTKGVIDTKRKKLVIIGNGEQWVFNLDSVITRKPLGSIGGTAIVNSLYPGLAYDQVEDKIVAWNGENPYVLDMDTRKWTELVYPNNPGPAVTNGTFGRWNYSPSLNAFILINSVDKDVYLFKWSNDTLPTAIKLNKTKKKFPKKKFPYNILGKKIVN